MELEQLYICNIHIPQRAASKASKSSTNNKDKEHLATFGQLALGQGIIKTPTSKNFLGANVGERTPI